jgi:hypothetical protein
MSISVIFEGAVAHVDGEARGEDLWLDPSALERGLGWRVKPEGLCRGPLCVPIPPGRRAELVRADGAVNLAALGRERGQAVVHDDGRGVWVCGPSGDLRATTARSLEAPDFTLPDLDGRLHCLSDARGKKVLLNSWASW